MHQPYWQKVDVPISVCDLSWSPKIKRIVDTKHTSYMEASMACRIWSHMLTIMRCLPATMGQLMPKFFIFLFERCFSILVFEPLMVKRRLHRVEVFEELRTFLLVFIDDILSQARHFQPLLIQRQWLVTQTLLQRLICMLLFEGIVGMTMPFVNPLIVAIAVQRIYKP